MAVIHHLIFFTSTIIFIPLVLTTRMSPASVPTRPKQLIIPLIHRDSHRSPYHNQNENISDRVQRSMNVSISRFTHLQETVQLLSSSLWSENYQANILPSIDASLFFVNFSIGQPPMPQITVMDTGSSLLWVRCLPCDKCQKQIGPMFNPSKSSTYTDLPCNSQYCWDSPGGECSSKKCSYNITYVGGVSSSGILAMEALTFYTSDEGIITLPDTVFGCSHQNGNFHDRQLTGIFGLGFGKLSVVSELTYSIFSYCINNLHDPNYLHNKLVLGHEANIEGDSTPLEVINGRYYITLEGISIGERKLDIEPTIFARKTNNKGGVVIDSGSSATWLAKAGFEVFRKEVELLLDVWLKRSSYEFGWLSGSSVCYEGVISRDVRGFPAATLHFADGADLVLHVESLFVQAWPNVFCLAVFPSFDANGENSLSVVGMIAQQNYNVGFDVPGRKVSFQRIECELLDD